MRAHSQALMTGAGAALVTLAAGFGFIWYNPWAAIAAAGAAAGVCGFVIARRAGARQSQARAHMHAVLDDLEQSADDAASGDPVARMDRLLKQLQSRQTDARSRLDLYARIFDALESGVLVVDEAGEIVLVNPFLRRLLDAPEQEITGRAVDTIFTEAELLDIHSRALHGEQAHGRVRLTRSHTAARTLDVLGVAAEFDSRRVVILSLHDVTETARAAQLKTDFVGNASHELRTPIAAIRAAVDTMLGPARDDESMWLRLGEMIRDHVGRLEELVRDLMDLSRFEAPEYAPALTEVDVLAVCHEVQLLLGPYARSRDVRVEFQIDPTVQRISTDRRALLLILRNLLENAIKFSHDGGMVTVESSAGGPDVVRLRVIDHGIGIPLSQQQRIFERFYQVDQARAEGVEQRGSGLGLAIVKHAVRRLGGEITVESIWRQGTTMTVELPIKVSESERPRAPGAEQTAAPEHGPA